MFNAAMAGYIGNLFSGQFTQAEAHETARKMLSSYLMFWAWNIYYQMRMDEQFTMKMRFRIGADPITGANGLTVQEIILRSTDDPTLTYTFDAAAAAMDCMNTICPISPEEIADEIADELADKIDAEETAEEDAEDDEESIPVFGMFGCSPAAFRSRIMRELYAAFPERYDAWEEEHASELFPPEEGSACTHPYSTAIQNA